MMVSRLVLPLPLGPMNASTSPGRQQPVIPNRICTRIVVIRISLADIMTYTVRSALLHIHPQQAGKATQQPEQSRTLACRNSLSVCSLDFFFPSCLMLCRLTLGSSVGTAKEAGTHAETPLYCKNTCSRSMMHCFDACFSQFLTQ